MRHPSRPVLRRRLLLLGVVPLVLALALTVRVAALVGLDERGRSTFGSGELESARDAFAANAVLDVFEPWVAVYDEGTTAYRQDDLAAARSLLGEALGMVPEQDECLVRINLALTLEALGDAHLADGRREEAAALWTEALGVLDAGRCRSAGSAPAAGRSVGDRLLGKLADRAEPDEAPPTPEPPEQAEELEQRNDEAQQQHRDNEETRENEPEPPPPPAESEPPAYAW